MSFAELKTVLVKFILTGFFVLLPIQFASDAGGRETPLAFPGAEGFGRYTQGGRGGRLIAVDNLNPNGPGSLAAAIGAAGPRVVVFRVGGIIELKENLTIKNPYITIAGQTAPGDGICLRGAGLVVATREVIIRFVRVRVGDQLEGANPESRDGLAIIAAGQPVYNVVIDHCSVSWAIDENVSTYGQVQNITIQWSIISESLLDSLHPKGVHGMGMLLGRKNCTISVHHNLFAHNYYRNPLVYSHQKETQPMTVDIRNNVIYNYGGPVYARIEGPSLINYVGNLVKAGPNSKKGGVYFKSRAKQYCYEKDNLWIDRDGGRQDRSPFLKRLPMAMQSDTPFPAASVTTQPASSVYAAVLRHVGAYLPQRDTVDTRIINEVKSGSGAIIDTLAQVGGWPGYLSGQAPTDVDNDGLPDDWEIRNGLSQQDAADAKTDLDGDGYDNLEEFLNGTGPKNAHANQPIEMTKPAIQNQVLQRSSPTQAQGVSKDMKPFRRADVFIKAVKASGLAPARFLGLRFAQIPGGRFIKGWAGSNIEVVLSQPYEITVFEITQKQWETVMGTRPWEGRLYAKNGPENAASYVSWEDCQEFIKRLNTAGKRHYRLPTEAEWDFASMAGRDAGSVFGFNQNEIGNYAWYAGNTVQLNQKYAHSVGRKRPNALAIFDMAGNVAEWCQDVYRYHYWRRAHLKIDPRGEPVKATAGTLHPVRGGAFYYTAGQIMKYYPDKVHRSTYRNFDTGFRLVRILP